MEEQSLHGSIAKALALQSSVHEFKPRVRKLFSILQGFYAILLIFCSQNTAKTQQNAGFRP